MFGGYESSRGQGRRERVPAVPQATLREGSISQSYPMLNKSNYSAWCIKMESYMKGQGVWEAVMSEKLVETRRDKMALAFIYQGLSDETVIRIGLKKSAKEAWESLRTMHLGARRAEAWRNPVASKLGYPEEVGSGGHEKLHVGGDTTAPAKKGTVIKSYEEEKRLGGFSDPRLDGAMNVESFNGGVDKNKKKVSEEARENNYKRDDASSEVVHETDEKTSEKVEVEEDKSGSKTGESEDSVFKSVLSNTIDNEGSISDEKNTGSSSDKIKSEGESMEKNDDGEADADGHDTDIRIFPIDDDDEAGGFDKDGDEDAMRLEGDGKMAQELKADNDDVRDTGWFFVCNQSYTTTEEELMEHSSEFKRALEELDNSIFQGRLLNVLPAKPRETSDKQIDETTHLPKTLKQKKEEQRKVSEAGGNTKAWNSLFMQPDTILENIVRVYGVSKSELLDRESDDPAVSLALGETKVIAETKEALAKAGVNVASLEEFATGKDKIFLPPTKTMVLVVSLEPAEARVAFKTDGVKKKVRKKKEKKKKKMYLKKTLRHRNCLRKVRFFVEEDKGGRRSRVQTYDEQEEELRRAVTDAVKAGAKDDDESEEEDDELKDVALRWKCLELQI